MLFFKRKKKKERNKKVAPGHVNGRNDNTTNDWLIHNTNTSSAISNSSDYSGYDHIHSSSCSSHSSYDSGSSFDSSSSCD
ncbi:hypothetical protein BK708_01450 [Bacillus thuringiensis serovar yunnanensis]|nr:hypothetical protein BK708_01450 [Bacillus thuringiensis serovar yunnanensis]